MLQVLLIVWSPRNVPSATTSRNHRAIAATVVARPIPTSRAPEPPRGGYKKDKKRE
ncbi:hypothetical protein OOU_Y34scaffold01112g7 [Pyricularia oryzae Y34]|uniref:Uncharacterized protein n=1 Tax=Pyricularia oryzae (strain Y34) TaxID=1143189 RepID=A0AA97NLU6_PYRO3|nr:hypothetical protein OOU_Y34scaffold01112g7 [Pyricularia oryzae Y34]